MVSVTVENLTKHFDYYVKEVGLLSSVKNIFKREKLVKESVKGISFEIEEGEIVGFLGPNGAGKTTTLKMLSGILYPTAGSARVLGFIPWERKNEFKKQFSIIMGQKNQLWWDLPANESLNLNKCIYELDEKEYRNTVSYLTELLEVKHVLDIQVRRLSLGERMKLEIIAALLHKPRIIFLDEPTIGLDIISQKNIREFLKEYNREAKTTIMLTSHYMRDIEDLCKRTIVINQGSIIYDGNLDGINGLLDSKKIIRLQLSQQIDKDVFDRMGKTSEYDGLNVKVEVDRKDLSVISRLIMDTLPVVDLSIEDIPLEVGMEKLYKDRCCLIP